MSQIIKNITILAFEATTITGVTSADDGDGEAFTSKGVRYLPKHALNPFAAARQATHTALLRLGTKFLNGYAVPHEDAAEAAQILREKEQLWEQLRQDLIRNYHWLRDEWVREHPEVEPYQGFFPTLERVEQRTAFTWTSFQVNPTEEQFGGSGMAKTVSSLHEQVIREIVKDVQDSWTPGGSRITTKTRGIIVRVAEKLGRLAFLGGALGDMARSLQKVIQRLPSSGPLEGIDATLASMVLAMLSSESSALQVLQIDPERIVLPQAAPAAAVGGADFDFSDEDESVVPSTEAATEVVPTELSVTQPETPVVALPVVPVVEDPIEEVTPEQTAPIVPPVPTFKMVPAAQDDAVEPTPPRQVQVASATSAFTEEDEDDFILSF